MPKKNGNKPEKNDDQEKKGEDKVSKAAYTIADSLAHLLQEVLNSGLIVAGDVKLKVSDLELLIKLRLIVTTIDKARDLGIDWWDQDRFYTTSEPTEFQKLKTKEAELKKQLDEARKKAEKSRPKRKKGAKKK